MAFKIISTSAVGSKNRESQGRPLDRRAAATDVTTGKNCGQLIAVEHPSQQRNPDRPQLRRRISRRQSSAYLVGDQPPSLTATKRPLDRGFELGPPTPIHSGRWADVRGSAPWPLPTWQREHGKVHAKHVRVVRHGTRLNLHHRVVADGGALDPTLMPAAMKVLGHQDRLHELGQ